MSPSLGHSITSTTHLYICITSTYSVVLNLALAHIVILCFLPLSFAGGTFRRHHQKPVGEILLERMVIVDLQILLQENNMIYIMLVSTQQFNEVNHYYLSLHNQQN